MNRKMTPRSFWSFPMLRFPSLSEEGEEEGWLENFSEPSGLSVSEDETHVYVEAAVPGLKTDEIEMTFDKGILWIKGEKKEESEEKNKKYYRKALSTFSYRIAVPGNVDDSQHPDAVCKNGVLRVTFTKTSKSEPKKIPIKNC
jgi:HSP20 family protein